MTEETAYHLLQRRRRELAAQISALKGQLAPKVAELAQIDRMLAAADPTPPASSVLQNKTEGTSGIATTSDYAAALRPFLDPVPKFASMTIKGLVVQAMIDHFPKGGKVADIREFIRVGYGREIDAASLRPQMHRLKADAILIQDGEIWNLDARKRQLYSMYDHPTSRAAMKELQDDKEVDHRGKAAVMKPHQDDFLE